MKYKKLILLTFLLTQTASVWAMEEENAEKNLKQRHQRACAEHEQNVRTAHYALGLREEENGNHDLAQFHYGEVLWDPPSHEEAKKEIQYIQHQETPERKLHLESNPPNYVGMWEHDYSNGWKVGVEIPHRCWSPQGQEYNDNKQQRKQERKIQERNRPRALVEYPVSKRVEERQITMAEFDQLQGQGTKIKFYGRARSNGKLKRIDYRHYLERLGHKKHRPVIAEICGQ